MAPAGSRYPTGPNWCAVATQAKRAGSAAGPRWRRLHARTPAPMMITSAREKRRTLSDASDLYRGAIADHFGHTLHHLGGIVPNPDDGIGAEPLRMPQRQLERISARLLTPLRAK